MPTPRLQPGHPKWPLVEQISQLISQGLTAKDAGQSIGITPDQARRYKDAWLRWQSIDPLVKEGMTAVGTGEVPRLLWAKTKSEDGTSFSAMFRPPELSDSFIDTVRDAFENMPAAEPTTPPERTVDDLLALYPIFDAHVGMMAWGAETSNEDYDLSLATQQLRDAFERILTLTPNAKEAVLLIGGDFFHIDDSRNETPASHHNLDVDGRFWKVINSGVSVLKYIIPRLLGRHEKVTIRVLRGNHDEHSFAVLPIALSEHFRRDAGVDVQMDPRIDLFMHQWGKSAIFAHHGDRRFKAEQAALYISDVCPFWSETRHRHMFTGHVHHDSAKDVGPMKWESLRAFCPPDAYAASMAYASRRSLQAFTFHKEDGMVLRAMDPVAK